MSSGWLGRNTVLHKGLVFVTSALLFLCFTSIDLQMRFYEHFRATEPESRMSWDASQGKRRLSSHDDNHYYVREHAKRTDEQNLSFVLDHSRRLPQAIIIGVKKGGTRALLEILRLHPDVKAPGPEPHFFDRHYSKGLQWYRRQMPRSQSTQLTIEKTPSYFITPEVPPRIYNMSREVLLIVVVRDPVTRAVSDYMQTWSKRHGDSRTFEDRAFLNASTGLLDTNWVAIRIGVYARHLERWLAFFPKAQFHFVSGERLVSDPVSEVSDVQKFLGLRPFISEDHFVFNQTKGFPCLRRIPHSNATHCLDKTKGRPHPYISPSALQRLRDFYRPFNQKFYRMVGRNFGWL